MKTYGAISRISLAVWSCVEENRFNYICYVCARVAVRMRALRFLGFFTVCMHVFVSCQCVHQRASARQGQVMSCDTDKWG